MRNFGEVISGACSSVVFRDARGIRCEVNSRRSNPFLKLDTVVRNKDARSAQLQLKIKNIGRETVVVERAAVLDVAACNQGVLDMGGLMTDWTILHGRGRQVSDLCNEWFDNDKSDFYASHYCIVGNRRMGKYITLGFLSFMRQTPSLELKASRTPFKFQSLRALCDCGAYPLVPGAEMVTETLYINWNDAPQTALRAYLDLLADCMGTRPVWRDVVGWSTWDYYLGKVTERDVLENAHWLAEHRDVLPVEYIQLDHGFQRCEGDWLKTNERFPHGLRWLSNKIHALGFKPGLWLCPFLIAPRSRVYREHPDWVIKDQSGRPLEVNGYEVRRVYALDCSIPAACDWVRDLADKVTRQYRFAYIKLDGANYQCMSTLGVLRDSRVSKAEAARRGLQSLREGMAEDAVLLDTSFALGIGVADAMRAGPDVGARWDSSRIDKHHGERDNYPGPGFIRRSVAASANTSFLHKRLWVNDPDYLIVRRKGDRSELSLEEARSWVTFTGMSNGLIMLADRMRSLDRKRVKLLSKVLPHYRHGALPVDFFQRDCPSVFNLEVSNESEEWRVLAVINTLLPERIRDFEVSFRELGLNERRRFHLWDFWQEKYLGVHRGKILIEELSPHQTMLIGIREARKAIPQILATDMHITQGGVEIAATRFDPFRMTLNIRTMPCGKSGRIFVFVPAGLRPIGGVRMERTRVYAFKIKADGRSVDLQFEGRAGKARKQINRRIKASQNRESTVAAGTQWVKKQEGVAGLA